MMEKDQMRELQKQGYFCGDMIMIMGLKMQGKSNPDIVRCMRGLACGLGFSGEVCGALIGGVCLLGLYAGKGQPDERDNPCLMLMVADLVRWFKEGFGVQYGGIRCEDILQNDSRKQLLRCPLLVSGTFLKVKELLNENGFNLKDVRSSE